MYTDEMLPKPQYHWVVFQWSTDVQEIRCISPQVWARGWTITGDRRVGSVLKSYMVATANKRLWRVTVTLDSIPDPHSVLSALTLLWGGPEHGRTIRTSRDDYVIDDARYVRLPSYFNVLDGDNGRLFVPEGHLIGYQRMSVASETVRATKHIELHKQMAWAHLERAARVHSPNGYMHTYRVQFDVVRDLFLLNLDYVMPPEDTVGKKSTSVEIVLVPG